MTFNTRKSTTTPMQALPSGTHWGRGVEEVVAVDRGFDHAT
jgi:hypothetical protein